jgi:hypothetical protein
MEIVTSTFLTEFGNGQVGEWDSRDDRYMPDYT